MPVKSRRAVLKELQKKKCFFLGGRGCEIRERQAWDPRAPGCEEACPYGVVKPQKKEVGLPVGVRRSLY